MTRFYDLFSDCRASLEPFEAALTAAEILKIEHDGAHRHLAVTGRFAHPVSSRMLDSIAACVTESLGGAAQVELLPRFDRTQLDSAYAPELTVYLKKHVAVANGFLDDAEWDISPDAVRVTLHHGGKAILENGGFAEALRRVVSERFGAEPAVRLEEAQVDIAQSL